MTTEAIAAYKPGDLLDVRVEKIVPGGHGLAFADGLTLFVDLAVAGDRVSARIREVKGKIAFADIESIIEPAPSRIDPPCPYVGRCGGCNFQQMTYQAQLDAKIGIVRDCLHRIGKFDYEHDIPIIPSPVEFAYRLRAQWHIDGRRKEIGYYALDSRNLVAIEHCPILIPELDSVLNRVRRDIDWTSFWSDKGAIDASCGAENAVSIYSAELGESAGEISLSAGGENYTFAADVFFQGNKFLIDTLIQMAIGDVSGETALDLYCGVGLFTLPLARRFKKVIAVEEFGKAVDYTRKNVESAGCDNIEIIEKPVGRFLAEKHIDEVDFALLDPPRSGTEKKTVLDLIRLRPKQVSYVSCDPSVLARDLRRFLDCGYVIKSITALDLFPQTHHVETVIHLSCR
ncbi:MAG TPA: RsmD family RNA methyltransferase [Pyrinomonadaceae bacterium]|nr:RsmD family RNA methyltransferase [Pyrinomonadaceae bacterium]